MIAIVALALLSEARTTAAPLEVASQAERSLLLQGKWRFAIGDNPEWASRDFDDSSWRLLPVPAGWSRSRVPISTTVGWYRTQFDAPRWLADVDAAVQLGVIYRADEVFLNGVRIGGEGTIGVPHSEAVIEPPMMHRIYRIPMNLVHFDGPNTLAVRVGSAVGDGGLVGGPVRIVDYAEARLSTENYRLRSWSFESCLLSIDLLVAIVSITLLITGVRERAFLLFAVLWLPFLAIWILESRPVYEAIGLPVMMKWAILLAAGNAVLVTPDFFAEILEARVNRKVRALQAAILVNNATFSLSYWGMLGPGWLSGSVIIFLVCWAALSAYCLTWAGSGILNRRSGAWPLLVGISSYWVCQLTESLSSLPQVSIDTGVEPVQVGARLFWLCSMYVAVDRYRRVQLHNRELSGRILDAQEEERARLARDLHDSVGQALSSIKLSVDMLQATAGDDHALSDELGKLSTDTSATIQEVRRVSADLRPGVLEHAGLVDAVTDLGEMIRRKDGLNVSVEADAALPGLTPRIANHLYRICQESIRNAVEHGGADQIVVRLESFQANVRLQIDDNGSGIDQGRELTERRGVGLQSIAERAELLGGVANVRNLSGAGTRVEVIVPAKVVANESSGPEQ